MIERIGLKAFLCLSWGVFRKKYFPGQCEPGTDPRSETAIERDRRAGAHLILALLLGSVFTFEPLILAITIGVHTSDAMLFAVSSMICGIIFLAIPFASAICIMVRLNKHGEKILDDILKS